MTGQAVGGVRVLDFGGMESAYFTRIMADLGADVIKVEPPTGDPSRRYPPFAGAQVHPERSLVFQHFQAHKRGITLDPEHPDADAILQKLIPTANVVVRSGGLGGRSARLNPEHLFAVRRDLIVVSISGYGEEGPCAGWPYDDLTVLASGGLLFVTGEPDRPPARPGNGMAWHLGSLYALIGTLAALYAGHPNGEHIEVAMNEAVAALLEGTALDYFHTDHVTRRLGSQHPLASPDALYPCKDGYFCFVIVRDEEWELLLEWLREEGVAGELDDPRWSTRRQRVAEYPVVNAGVSRLTQRYTMQELYREAQRRRIAGAPAYTPGDLLGDPQLLGRGYFQKVGHPELGELSFAGPPFRLTECPMVVNRPAPLLGQHNHELYCGELGCAPEMLERWQVAGLM